MLSFIQKIKLIAIVLIAAATLAGASTNPARRPVQFGSILSKLDLSSVSGVAAAL